MLFSDLESICKGKILNVKNDSEITHLVFDTRNLTISKGTLFFAIEGENHDGHDYIEEAFSKGVRLFVVEKEPSELAGASVIQVDSAIKALQQIAKSRREKFDFPVIGITGSNGKTIVKEWLSMLLVKKFNVVKSPKSYNSQIGVPLSVWQMQESHEVGIFEAGISRVGEMENLKEIINPTIGIFTNIGEAHNTGFESKLEKAKEKALLFRNCEKVIFPLAYEEIRKALSSATNEETELIGWTSIDLGKNNYEIKYGEDSFKLKLKFEEPYFIENAIHCAIALRLFGFSIEEIQSGISILSPVKMRLELKQAIGQSYLIDDTYNNDLHGLEVALDFLSRQNQKRKKSAILSDISQTGLDGKELYGNLNKLLVKNNVESLIGIGESITHNSDQISIPAEYFKSTKDFLKTDIRLNDELVLIKGARNFSFEQIVRRLEKNTHETILEINLENVVHNLNFYRSKLASETKLMVMVKAYAYGGGFLEIANLLQFHKVDYLGVAYADEGIELRKNGIYIPIMVMNPSVDSFRQLKEYNLEPEIYNTDLLVDFITFFEDEDSSPGIHLKIESGMNRLGFSEQDIPQVMYLLSKNKQVRIKSIFSHLAGSESPIHDSFSKQQFRTFTECSELVMKDLWYKPARHIANTGGISRFPEFHLDMVRLGIGLYGFDPTGEEQNHLKTVGTLKSRISQIRSIRKGQTVGYGRKGVANKDMTIAIVPIGYADGYLRAFGNGKGSMLVNGNLAKVFGNVCMDMVMLNVSEIECRIGDEVIIYGNSPTVEDLAAQIDTIPYEILTNIGQRVKRVFQSE